MANATLRYQEFRSSGGRRKKEEGRRIVFTNPQSPIIN